MDYASFVRAHQDAFLRQFVNDPGQCFVGVPSLQAFDQRHFHRGTWRTLAQVPLPEAVIYEHGAGNEELWVKPNDKHLASSGRYRKCWEAFLAELRVSGPTETLGGRRQHIDHLLPETFAARQGYAYVRIMAIDARGNLTVGSTVEKSMAARSGAGRSYLADWFTAAKVSCFPGSFAASVTPAEVMSALRKHLASRGFTLPPGQESPGADCMEAILHWSRGA